MSLLRLIFALSTIASTLLPHSFRSYLVSVGPSQRKETGEEELAPANDSSQAPVEASHACVCPVLYASLLSPFLALEQDPATARYHEKDQIQEEKDHARAVDPVVGSNTGQRFFFFFSKFFFSQQFFISVWLCVCNSKVKGIMGVLPASHKRSRPLDAQEDPEHQELKNVSLSFHLSVFYPSVFTARSRRLSLQSVIRTIGCMMRRARY